MDLSVVEWIFSMAFKAFLPYLSGFSLYYIYMWCALCVCVLQGSIFLTEAFKFGFALQSFLGTRYE